MVGFGSYASVVASEIVGAQRGAVVYESSQGWLQAVVGTADRFGLVLQNGSSVDFTDPANALVGGEHDILSDGALEVPSAPPLPAL